MEESAQLAGAIAACCTCPSQHTVDGVDTLNKLTEAKSGLITTSHSATWHSMPEVTCPAKPKKPELESLCAEMVSRNTDGYTLSKAQP